MEEGGWDLYQTEKKRTEQETPGVSQAFWLPEEEKLQKRFSLDGQKSAPVATVLSDSPSTLIQTFTEHALLHSTKAQHGSFFL